MPRRSVDMAIKGIVIVPSTVKACGRWLDSSGSASLLRVGNRPVICHVLDALHDAGAGEIAVLVPSSLREEVALRVERDRRSHPSVRYVDRPPSADGWPAVYALARFAGDAPTILHSSEGVLGEPLTPHVDLLAGSRADMLLLAVEGARAATPLGPCTQRALGISELRPGRAGLGLADVCVVAPGAIADLTSKPPATAAHRFPGLTGLAETLSARRSFRVEARVVRGWHSFTGDPVDLLDVNRAVLDRLDRPAPTEARDGNRLEGNVEIHPSASIAASVICGPAVIGAGATVKDSYIGPHTSIGERVRIEGAEIERSIVFAGASIRHVGDRLVASVIGRDAEVFKDFSVPRAMRLWLGDGDEMALC